MLWLHMCGYTYGYLFSFVKCIYEYRMNAYRFNKEKNILTTKIKRQKIQIKI